MGLTAEQLQARKSGLFASDIPALFLTGWFTDANRLWAEKCMDLLPDSETSAMAAGNRGEDWCRQEAIRQLGAGSTGPFQILPKDASGTMHLPREQRIFGATLDDYITVGDRVGPLECKVVLDRDLWEATPDKVPDAYMLQVHAQMLVTGAQHAWVAAAMWPFELRIYPIERDERIIAAIVKRGCLFWHDYVVPRIKPDGWKPTLDIMRRVPRQVPKEVDATAELDEAIADWIAAKELAADAGRVKDDAYARVLELAGDATTINATRGVLNLKYTADAQTIDTRRLEAENPELVAKYRTTRCGHLRANWKGRA